VRVDVVDPPAYTPPYDHALCRALAAAGARTRLVTSRFAYGSVPQPDGYALDRRFYRWAPGRPGSHRRRAARLAQHVPDMLAYRRAALRADVVHLQWLAVPQLDARLLPARRPLVLTAHDILPREPRPGQRDAQRRLYDRVDAVVVHSRHGRERLVELEVDSAKVHVIPHGVLDHLLAVPREQPLGPELAAVDAPVVLLLGLLRPYKGIDVLLRAWRGISDAELWIAGAPRMDLRPLRQASPPGVRWLTGYLPDQAVPALLRRADVVVLPYREIDQSGVLFTALAFGRPLLLSRVGGFPEIAEAGAAELVAPDDAVALHLALRRLLDEPARRQRLAAGARAAAAGRYAWGPIARRTLSLYEELAR
jgi:glycosyltransferase involved in cell wall biosynthesis